MFSSTSGANTAEFHHRSRLNRYESDGKSSLGYKRDSCGWVLIDLLSRGVSEEAIYSTLTSQKVERIPRKRIDGRYKSTKIIAFRSASCVRFPPSGRRMRWCGASPLGISYSKLPGNFTIFFIRNSFSETYKIKSTTHARGCRIRKFLELSFRL